MRYEKRHIKARLTAQQASELLCSYGKNAFEMAQKIILEEGIKNRKVQSLP